MKIKIRRPWNPKSSVAMILILLLNLAGISPGRGAGKKPLLHLHTASGWHARTPMTRRWRGLPCKGSSIVRHPNSICFRGPNTRPQFWLEILSKDGRWLEGRRTREESLPDIRCRDKTRRQATNKARSFGTRQCPPPPMWPQRLRAFTTLVVISPEIGRALSLPSGDCGLLKDWRGKFTGAETGSRKNDRLSLGDPRIPDAGIMLFASALPVRRFLHRAHTGETSAMLLTRDWAC